MATPLNRRVRNAAGANAVRVRKPTLPNAAPRKPTPPVPGQTPPIVPQPPRTPAPPAPNALPTLNANQRQLLQERFPQNAGSSYGSQGGIGLEETRRMMRQGMDAGLRRGQVNQFMNPGFNRGINDPNGRGLIGKDFNDWQGLAGYARNAEPMNATASQAALFDAFPELRQQYMAQANSYKAPYSTDATNPNSTPGTAVIGSDGQYHDPSKPLPPGVTIEGGVEQYQNSPYGSQNFTQPATPQQPQQPGGQQPGQQTQIATPEAAAAAGKDPTKHIAYWESVGYSYNPATDKWTDRNGSKPNPGQPNKPAPPGQPNDPNGPQSPGVPAPGGTPAPGSTPTQPTSQLPLDPMYEAQRRQLDAELQRQLASVNAGQGRLTAEQQLAEARLGTNQGVDQQRLLENMAGRGTVNSSIMGDQTGLLATDYNRQYTDLASSIADAMAGLAGQEGDAQSQYEMGIIEALLGSAQDSANDSYAPTPHPSTAPQTGLTAAQKRARRKRRRERRREES